MTADTLDIPATVPRFYHRFDNQQNAGKLVPRQIADPVAFCVDGDAISQGLTRTFRLTRTNVVLLLGIRTIVEETPNG